MSLNGTESWTYVSSANRFYVALADISTSTIDTETMEGLICDRFRTVAYQTGASNPSYPSITGRSGIAQINVFTTIYTSLDAFKSALSASNMQVVYPLATPLTYTLTPSQITSLLGTNHIWADCGEVAVEYVADTKMYIDNLLASQG